MTNTLGIFGGRASGKSTQVIKVAVENGYDIVVHSEYGKKFMEDSLRRYEKKDDRVKEVKVYTIREITDRHKRDGSVLLKSLKRLRKLLRSYRTTWVKLI